MKEVVLIALALNIFFSGSSAQVIKSKVIDNGGSGPNKAIAASEETLLDYTGRTMKSKQFN